MTFDKAYYDQRKAELQADYQKAVFECQEDCERAVIKKLNKQRDLQVKLQELEEKEKASKEKSPKPK